MGKIKNTDLSVDNQDSFDDTDISENKITSMNKSIRSCLLKLYNLDKVNGKKSYFSIKKALDTFDKYQTPINDMSQCLNIPNFSKKLCKRLKDEVESYKSSIKCNQIIDPKIPVTMTYESIEKSSKLDKILKVSEPSNILDENPKDELMAKLNTVKDVEFEKMNKSIIDMKNSTCIINDNNSFKNNEKSFENISDSSKFEMISFSPVTNKQVEMEYNDIDDKCQSINSDSSSLKFIGHLDGIKKKSNKDFKKCQDIAKENFEDLIPCNPIVSFQQIDDESFPPHDDTILKASLFEENLNHEVESKKTIIQDDKLIISNDDLHISSKISNPNSLNKIKKTIFQNKEQKNGSDNYNNLFSPINSNDIKLFSSPIDDKQNDHGIIDEIKKSQFLSFNDHKIKSKSFANLKSFDFLDENFAITTNLHTAKHKYFDGKLFVLIVIDYMDLVLSHKRYRLETDMSNVYESKKAAAFVQVEDLEIEFFHPLEEINLNESTSLHKEPIDLAETNMKDLEELNKIEKEMSMIFDPDFTICLQSKSTPNQDDKKYADITKYLIDENICTSLLLPGTFDIVLLVDSSEPDFIHNEMKLRNTKCEKKKLNIGDFTWIARNKDYESDENDVILDLIIERKTSEDLASSITDGRFSEQKSRLKRSMISNIFYLHEKSYRKSNIRFNKMLSPDAIRQALFNTLICDGFFVKQTKNVDGTIEFLFSLTQLLKNIYLEKTICSIGYNEFIGVKANCKFPSLSFRHQFMLNHQSMDRSLNKTNNLTIRDIFAQSLLKIPGVGMNKAIEIIKHYPTPRSLIQQYLKFEGNDTEKENLLANIKYGTTGRKIGNTVSKSIYDFFTKKF